MSTSRDFEVEKQVTVKISPLIGWTAVGLIAPPAGTLVGILTAWKTIGYSMSGTMFSLSMITTGSVFSGVVSLLIATALAGKSKQQFRLCALWNLTAFSIAGLVAFTVQRYLP
jgi:hypothetical protein